ncbi:MAG TPA: hypothetical protein IAC83_06300 [Euryarchaeota archaeon]|nr:hypothetical protein [Euryarchaeota archaeon]
MAKKKRRLVEEPKEEYEFTPTEFNEREFILKDIYMTKVFLVVTVLAIIVGIIGALLCIHAGDNGWLFATIVSFVVCALLTKILGALKFRVDMFEMKSMLGNYLLFLMLALGICILLINEPFASIL